MCFSKSQSAQPQTPPAPNPATTFDYNVAQRAQTAADAAIRQRQSATVLSQTQPTGSYGSELGTSTMNQPNPQAP